MRSSDVELSLPPTRSKPLARGKRRNHKGVSPGALLLASALSFGCHDYRGEECRAFVLSVNSKLEAIDRVTANKDPSHSVSAADMRQLAKLYEDLAKYTTAADVKTKELVKLRADYHVMVEEAARLARGVADALDAKDLETAMKAHARFGEVVSKEDLLVGQVNAFCQTR